MKLYEACQDKQLMKELHGFFVDTLREVGLQKMFDREDVSAVAEAKEILDKAFDDIDSLEYRFSDEIRAAVVIAPNEITAREEMKRITDDTIWLDKNSVRCETINQSETAVILAKQGEQPYS